MRFTEPVELCSDCSALLLDFIHSGHHASHATAGQVILTPRPIRTSFSLNRIEPTLRPKSRHFMIRGIGTKPLPLRSGSLQRRHNMRLFRHWGLFGPSLDVMTCLLT